MMVNLSRVMSSRGRQKNKSRGERETVRAFCLASQRYELACNTKLLSIFHINICIRMHVGNGQDMHQTFLEMVYTAVECSIVFS